MDYGEAVVHYFGFEIERITGIPEAEIEKYGCRYSLSREAFQKVVEMNGAGGGGYDDRDVRAKIAFSDEVYFVDRRGNVRSDRGHGVLNKGAFAESLVLVGDCG